MHLLQSENWQNFEKMEGEEVFALEGERYVARGVVKKTPVGNYLYVKYGPEICAGEAPDEREAGMAEALGALRELAREKGAFCVRIEPTLCFSEQEMKKMGAVRSKELNPEHTWVLDLTRPEEEILAGMEKSTVKFWRNAAKKGIEVRISQNPEDIAILMPFLAETAGKRGFLADDAERLKNQMRAGFAKLYIAEIPAEVAAGFDGDGGDAEKNEKNAVAAEKCEKMAEKDGKIAKNCARNAKKTQKSVKKVPIAASLIYDYDGVRYSVHSGSSTKYRKLRGGMVLSVEKILDAKRAGAKKYDFWGVTTSQDPKHPWYGFTQHKKSFGGEQVDYTGTYDLVIDKFRYLLYKTMRKVNLMMRKRGC